MNRRERMEARLERRRRWAEARRERAAEVARDAEHYRGDHAFNSQPGHIPERARLNRRQARAAQDHAMSEHHDQKADGIARQLKRTIFSDDDAAAEALEAKAAALDAQADRAKAINAAFRKAPGADKAAKLAALVAAGTVSDEEAAKIARLWGLCHWERQPFPAYHLTNLRANARRCRERIADIKRRGERRQAAEDAGGVTVTRANGYATVCFAEFPGRDVIRTLKAAGFHWSGGAWHGREDKLPPGIE